MSQQVFSRDNRIAAAASGNPTAAPSAATNFVVYNKTLGTVNGQVVSGTGTTQTYTVTPASIENISKKATVTGNGTNGIVIDFTLEAGESFLWVGTSTGTTPTYVLSGCEMRHTAAGARDPNFDQVILSQAVL